MPPIDQRGIGLSGLPTGTKPPGGLSRTLHPGLVKYVETTKARNPFPTLRYSCIVEAQRMTFLCGHL